LSGYATEVPKNEADNVERKAATGVLWLIATGVVVGMAFLL